MWHSGLEHTVDALVFPGWRSARVFFALLHKRVCLCVCVGCSNYGGGGLVRYSDLLLRVSQ